MKVGVRMKKKHFVTLSMFLVFGLSLSIGMCLWLLETNYISLGYGLTAIGFIGFVGLGLRFMPRFHVDKKILWKMIYSIFSVMVFGAGMALSLAIEGQLMNGIIVGVIGLILMLGNIPVWMGLKD